MIRSHPLTFAATAPLPSEPSEAEPKPHGVQRIFPVDRFTAPLSARAKRHQALWNCFFEARMRVCRLQLKYNELLDHAAMPIPRARLAIIGSELKKLETAALDGFAAATATLLRDFLPPVQEDVIKHLVECFPKEVRATAETEIRRALGHSRRAQGTRSDADMERQMVSDAEQSLVIYNDRFNEVRTLMGPSFPASALPKPAEPAADPRATNRIANLPPVSAKVQQLVDAGGERFVMPTPQRAPLRALPHSNPGAPLAGAVASPQAFTQVIQRPAPPVSLTLTSRAKTAQRVVHGLTVATALAMVCAAAKTLLFSTAGLVLGLVPKDAIVRAPDS